MVQGLKFLSKKSWHVKNAANQEKVWLAEQRKEAEDRKTRELAQQIQQEREEAEIKGKKDRGIEWMYEGQSKDSNIFKEDKDKEKEEYLLGKKYAPAGGEVTGGDFVTQEDEGVNKIVEKVSSRVVQEQEYNEPTVAQRNEAFRVRHEDPMFVVALETRHKQRDEEKKRSLQERLETNSRKDHKGHKRSKKDRKRRDRSRSSESGYRRKERKSHKRSRRDRSPDYDHSSSRRRSRSPSFDDKRPSRRPRESNNDGRYIRQEDRTHDRRPSGYGLQGKSVAKHAYLGPDQKLLEEKRREKEAKMYVPERDRRHRDPVERKAALEAMQRDAERRSHR